MSADPPIARSADGNNSRRIALILGLAAACAALYLALGLAGDLRQKPLLLLGTHAVLLVGMGLAWRLGRGAGPRAGTVLLAAALVFRLFAAVGEPALSDDVHRYVWDGRVQLHGVHPYAAAPSDPGLAELRDASWARINHPELHTIYPPLAQLLFLLLAALGAGPVGFKLVLGLLDFAVVLALGRLLRVLGLPRERLVLYAWNPLAVLETAGTGHVEPLGIVGIVLAAAWLTNGKPARSALALGLAVQAKLAPALLVPGYLRRLRLREILLLVVVVAALWLPYALTGPAIGAGLFEYAGRWQHNSFVFAGIERALGALDTGEGIKPWIAAVQRWSGDGPLPWETLYRWAWPGPLARLLCAALLVAWLLRLTFKPGLDAARETFLLLGGALLLAPTVHPWYVLWVLPFAAAYASRPWLVFGMLVPLSYAAGVGDVPWSIRCVEYLPLLALLAVELGSGSLYFPRRPAGGGARGRC